MFMSLSSLPDKVLEALVLCPQAADEPLLRCLIPFVHEIILVLLLQLLSVVPWKFLSGGLWTNGAVAAQGSGAAAPHPEADWLGKRRTPLSKRCGAF
uniref:Uncharacterized protein n=1 Tax=Chromera velia CCMP2878 TaxID=1169474 RepID=A0A0G4H2P5_9ALVE|eukprot:Cvel_24464.t1-p1 / transcript=Cvel_24464.t1 / gene=Cvel_24464 / organism=Chromera_velia_CCMP2878 / gene_product=hypothetical protein / transcript_product=hypothetical protein / location=Cvel_scaffold2647:2858-5582(+) / protein_length=96 / sequence_SO=supercontig / SO=protein_coding / is_pseudo=false